MCEGSQDKENAREKEPNPCDDATAAPGTIHGLIHENLNYNRQEMHILYLYKASFMHVLKFGASENKQAIVVAKPAVYNTE